MKIMLTVLTAGVVFVVGCATIKVKSEYGKGVDWTRFQTYNWVEQPENPFAYLTSKIDRKRIVKLIKVELDEKLQSRGYRLVKTEPDFQVAYHANVKGKIETAPLGYDSDLEMYAGREITVRDYQEGSLVLDFVDRKSNELIWRGIAVGAIQDVDRIESQIQEAVDKMLQSFPPRR